jgi:hypothetical protein
MMSIGDQRTQDYAAMYNVEGAQKYHEVERSESDCSLSFVRSQQSAIDDQAQHEHRKLVETSVDMLEGKGVGANNLLMTAAAGIAELERYRLTFLRPTLCLPTSS